MLMKKLSKYLLLSFLLVISAGSIVLYHKKQDVWDAWRLRNYSPSKRVSDIAISTTFTNKAKRLFYVYYPSLESRENFNINCRTRGEESIVLGCYNGENIYVYDVTDSKLNGVLEVTSAHEMLHAAYDRLGSGEKSRINKLLEDEAKKITDARLLRLIEQYKRQSNVDINNELHSIIGTEVRSVSPELEQYYRQYFINRSTVVEFSNQYEQVFVDFEKQISDLDKSLNQKKELIDANEASLNKLRGVIDVSRKSLDSLLASNKIAEYNSKIPAYNKDVNEYNSLITSLKDEIKMYNTLVEQRNSIVTAQTNLVKTLDSSTLKNVD